MEVKGKKGPEQFVADEHPRETTLEKLTSLKPVFKENGTVSAGNASVSGTFTLDFSLAWCNDLLTPPWSLLKYK